jgi:transcriptional regulator
MYESPLFKREDQPALIAAMRAHPLGLLVTAGPGGLQANAIPFLVIEQPQALPRLQAHLARANPQWRDIEAGAEALVVFQGPQRYVTPSWYATKAETGKVVPTWNYVIVQARGMGTTRHEHDWLVDHVSALTRRHEASRDAPWAVTDAPPEFIDAQAKGIVGIEIAVTKLAGKWKVSQNRQDQDRRGVVAGLRAEGHVEAEAMAALVEASGGGR